MTKGSRNVDGETGRAVLRALWYRRIVTDAGAEGGAHGNGGSAQGHESVVDAWPRAPGAADKRSGAGRADGFGASGLEPSGKGTLKACWNVGSAIPAEMTRCS
jgi:hypothetical protein